LGHGRSEVISSDKKTGEEKRITEVQDERGRIAGSTGE
jgi:hypothetical protein